MQDSHLANYEPHRVGSVAHVEYWIPAECLPQFNASLEGMISVEGAYFGNEFKGYIPDGFGLKGKDAVAQFVAMTKTWDYSPMDFVCEVATNRKAVYLAPCFGRSLIPILSASTISSGTPSYKSCARRGI